MDRKKGVRVDCFKKPKIKKVLSFGEKLIEDLSEVSSRLKRIKNVEEKVKILISLNKVLEDNKDFIKENCPDLLVSILNSL